MWTVIYKVKFDENLSEELVDQIRIEARTRWEMFAYKDSSRIMFTTSERKDTSYIRMFDDCIFFQSNESDIGKLEIWFRTNINNEAEIEKLNFVKINPISWEEMI